MGSPLYKTSVSDTYIYSFRTLSERVSTYLSTENIWAAKIPKVLHYLSDNYRHENRYGNFYNYHKQFL